MKNVSYSVSVPIIPEFLYRLEKHDLEPDYERDLDLLAEDTGTLATLTWLNATMMDPNHYGNHVLNMTFLSNLTDLLTFKDDLIPEGYINENSRVGWLFSSKAIVQLVANPFVGPLVSR